jgi:hypothetical protein
MLDFWFVDLIDSCAMKFALYVDIVQLFKTLDDSILCLNILVFMSMPITTIVNLLIIS